MSYRLNNETYNGVSFTYYIHNAYPFVEDVIVYILPHKNYDPNDGKILSKDADGVLSYEANYNNGNVETHFVSVTLNKTNSKLLFIPASKL